MAWRTSMENRKNAAVFLSEIFEEKPENWGLRGDPYLWGSLRETFAEVPVSVTPERFTEVFAEVFEKHTGSPLERGRTIRLQRYAHGGLSGGQICPEFWIENALPLLLTRLKDLQATLL